jgi:hypothetical protein
MDGRGRKWRLAGLAGATAVALLTTGLSGTALAAYPGADGLIAFVKGGNVYTISPSGTGLTKLTGGHDDSAPVWSPSGQEIAYLYRGNLWTMSANGSHKTQITRSAPGYTDARAAWSPNGQYLAYVKTQRGHGHPRLRDVQHPVSLGGADAPPGEGDGAA